MSCEAALKSEKNIPQSGSNLEFRPCQSPGIEIVGEGGSIEGIQPPSPTTQSRELSHRSKSKFEPDWGIHQKSKFDHLGIGSRHIFKKYSIRLAQDWMPMNQWKMGASSPYKKIPL